MEKLLDLDYVYFVIPPPNNDDIPLGPFFSKSHADSWAKNQKWYVVGVNINYISDRYVDYTRKEDT